MSKTIFNDENYEKKINYEDVNKFIICFNKIVNNFIEASYDNINISDEKYFKHIINKGIKTLTSVFNFLVLYTKNIEIILNSCEKSYLYFIEFIGQIGNDNKGYLQLTIKDATLFVYKKTIFDINNEFKKTFETTDDDKIILNTINKANDIINLHRIYLIENMNLINNKENIEQIKDLNSNFVNTLLLINNDNILVRLEKFNRFEEILQNISLQNINKDTYLILCELLIKKLKKMIFLCEVLLQKLTLLNLTMNLKIYQKIKF